MLPFVLSTTAWADTWLCIANDATGYYYDKDSKSWEQTSFNVEDSKHLVSPEEEMDFAYKVKAIGSESVTAYCTEGPSEYGWLFCEGWSNFRLNVETLRYTMVTHGSYASAGDKDDPPSTYTES